MTQQLGTFPDWALPYVFVLAIALWIGLLLLPPRERDWEEEQHDPNVCGCYGCRQEWADRERTPQD